MAYRFFGSELFDDAVAGAASTRPLSDLPVFNQPFSRLERSVIALAAREHEAGSGRGASRLAGVARLLFGIEGPSPLANPRLEALRRYTALARHRPREITPVEEEQFRAAGFLPWQASLIRSDMAARAA